jgi:hypothetical protein
MGFISDIINLVMMLICIASGFLVMVGFVFAVGYVLMVFYKTIIRAIRPDKKPSEMMITPPTTILKYRKLMNLSYIIIPASWVLYWFFYYLSFWYQEGKVSYLESIFMFVLFFLAEMSVVWCIWQWRNFKWFTLIPAVIAIFFIWLGRPPDSMRDRIIASRLEYNLPQYNQLIKTVKEKYLTLNGYRPESFPAIRVDSYKTESGNWRIRFFTGGIGLGTTLHWAYIYSENEEPSAGRYSTIRKIKPHWYWYQD